MSKRIVSAFQMGLMVLGSSGFSPVFAAPVACAPFGSGCFLTEMPVYSQNHPELSDLFPEQDPGQSNLCVPTAASMALETVLRGGNSPRGWSWSAKSFAGRSEPAQVRAMASLMWTLPEHGTSLGIEQYPLRSLDFEKTRSIHDQSWFRVVDDLLVQKRLTENAVSILNYGHYEESCSRSLGGSLYLCIYTRKGGHQLAVNGTHLDTEAPPFARMTRIYDPWYAEVRSIAMRPIPNKSMMTIFGRIIDLPTGPYLRNTRAWRVNGTSFKIVDRLDSLVTR
jgi:hypothetical protein